MTTVYVDPQTIHNPAAGGKPPATWGDTIRDDLEFLIAPPSVKAKRTTTQSISNATLTLVAFNATDEWDTDAFHDTTTNNSRLTVPAGLGGRYFVAVNIGWADNATGDREIQIKKNGSTVIANLVTESNWAGAQYLAVEVSLAVADYVETGV